MRFRLYEEFKIVELLEAERNGVARGRGGGRGKWEGLARVQEASVA